MAYVIRRDPTRLLETNVLFVLPEMLVLKCIDSAQNLKVRARLIGNTSLTSGEIAVSVLDTGAFSLLDIERMKTWHAVSRKIAIARKLIAFVKRATIDGVHEAKDRNRILRTIPHMGIDNVYNAAGHGLPFMEIAGYGGDKCLNDTCVYVASIRIAEESMKLTWRQPTRVNVVDSVLLQMSDHEQRDRFIDTKDHIFSEPQPNGIVYCPTYIDVEYPHWCGVIFDMERQVVWKYDPLHKKAFLDEVENIITGTYMKILKPHTKMKIRTFPGWLQQDGHSCGVLAVHWFELYLSIASSTHPDTELPLSCGSKMDLKQLSCMRYKHFSYVFDSVAANVDIEQ